MHGGEGQHIALRERQDQTDAPVGAGLQCRGVEEFVIRQRFSGRSRQNGSLDAAFTETPRHAGGPHHAGSVDAWHQARALRQP